MTGPIIDATLGFAADEAGFGIAYVSLASGSNRKALRVPFTVRRYPALLEREVGYAALTAVADKVAALGCKRVKFHIPDDRVVADLQERRDVPAPLAIEYVRLGCALNRFNEYVLDAGGDDGEDLTARARAEVTLHVAA